MTKNIFLSILIISAVLTGCSSSDLELQKSVFIPDPEFYELPQYSEWGYNTFGAYFDRQAFVSNDYEIPVKVVVTGGKTAFLFQGWWSGGGYYGYGNMTMTISLNNFVPENYHDLMVLNDSVIDLKNPDCSVAIKVDTIQYDVAILNGSFHVKRSQNLIVDGEQAEVILSGYFDFQLLLNDEPTTVTNGRFDIGVSDDNFFYY
jgi:hypothetical protein